MRNLYHFSQPLRKEPNVWDVISHKIRVCDYTNRSGWWHFICIHDQWNVKNFGHDHDLSFYHLVNGDPSYCYMQERRI